MTAFLLLSQAFYAQESEYEQKLQWQADKNAFEYRVEVKNSSSGAKVQEFQTEENVVKLSLPAGKYRYRVIALDFLGRESSVSEWTDFEIMKAVVPEIKKTAEKVVVPDVKNGKIQIPMEVASVTEETKVELVNETTKETVKGSLKLEKSADGTVSGKAEFPKVSKGDWKVKVTNPGGKTSESEVINLIDKKTEEEELARIAAEKARLEAEEKARIAAEEKARIEEEQRIKAEEERRLAEENARKAAEEEKRLAEENAKKAAEEEKRLAEENAKKAAEEEKRLAEENARKTAEEEKRLAEENARKAAEEEKRLAEENVRKAAEEEKRLAEENVRKAAEEEKRLAEENARKAAEEEKRLAAEEKKKQEEEEREQKRLARAEKLNSLKYMDMSFSGEFGIIYSPYDGTLVDEVIPVVIGKLNWVPVRKIKYRLGFELDAKLSMLDSAEEGCTKKDSLGIFDFNVMYQKPIVPGYLFLNMKAGPDVFIIQHDIEYDSSMSEVAEEKYLGYIGAQAGVSLVFEAAKHFSMEVGVDFNHIFMKDMMTGFVIPYAGVGVKW